MNVEIGAEATLFPGKEYISWIFFAVCADTKGVGPSTTLAWPGWKQPDIPVKVDRHNSKQASSKKVV